MNLRQASMSPVAVTIGETTYQLPKFSFGDWVAWQRELDDRTEQRNLASATPEQRAQLSAFYRVAPTDLNTIRQYLFTPEGIQRVVGTCMKRGGVPPDQIDGILAAAHGGDLERLAEELGDLESEDRRVARELIANLQSDLKVEREKSAALEAKLKKEGGASASPLPPSPPSTQSTDSTG